MQALILAAGSGTRFWPLSRRSNPRQLPPLEGERSLLQATVDRVPKRRAEEVRRLTEELRRRGTDELL